MDDELRRHLEESIQKPSAAHDYCSLDVPSEVLRNLLASLLLEPSPALMTSQLSTAEIRARVALLLHVNDLVLPLLPLLDASHGTRGPLGALVRKHRRLLFTKAKLSLFHS